MRASEQGTTSKVLTILFAEDDPFVRDLIGPKLRAHGYRVVEVESGDHALPILTAGGIDVLVTDISMPGELDGWSLAVQARFIHPGVSVVYSSSRPADAERQVSRSIYLRKPCHPEAVVAAIRHLTLPRGASAGGRFRADGRPRNGDSVIVRAGCPSADPDWIATDDMGKKIPGC